jgi:dienelactone hydrolase
MRLHGSAKSRHSPASRAARRTIVNTTALIDLPTLRAQADDRSLPDSMAGFIETPLGGGATVQRRAVVQNGCFGWLHTRADTASGDVAVLIATGLVWDALQPHHTLRLLADAIAAAGYPTLRLEYRGAGNSCDLPPEADPWESALASIHDAAEWLRATTGAPRLVLCGLRAGATLATLASASRADIAGLLLLAPVLRGSSYLKQLRIEAQLESPAKLPPDGGLSFYDISLGAEAARRIEAIDLRQTELPAGLRAALIPQAPSTLANLCAAAWRARGTETAIAPYDGLEPLLRDDVQTEHPPADFTIPLAWLRTAFPIAPRPRGLIALPPAILRAPGCTETPLRFGPDRRLSGVLCRPDRPYAAAGLAVVILNTGRNPQCGVGRFGVEFSRRLAGLGVAALRLDFAGLGDSTGPAGQENHHTALFDTDRRADIAAALDLLAGHGFTRFALQGLCSGAYHAFQAALCDPRVNALLLLNLPLFAWTPGQDTQFVIHKQTSPARYLARVLNPHDWRRLMRGEIELKRLLRAQAARLGDRLQAIAARLLGRPDLSGPHAAARKGLADFSRRRMRSLFLYCPNDPGLEPMELAFGPGAGELAQFPGATMRVEPSLDHLLSTASMREHAARLMIDALLSPL